MPPTPTKLLRRGDPPLWADFVAKVGFEVVLTASADF
jgi:hypothetical protein